MAPSCQGHRPFTVAVSGAAGSGKSTLGRALAAALHLPLLDLDSLTDPLLDRLLPGDWLDSPRREEIRDARYAALRAVARDVVATAGGAILVAPFTAEIRGGPEWEDLVEAVGPSELRLVHLHGDAELLAERRDDRSQDAVPGVAIDGEPHDLHRARVDETAGPSVAIASRNAERPTGGEPLAASPPAGLPTVPHVTIDADLTPEQQLFRALRALGQRTEIDPRNDLFARDFDAVLCDLDGVLVDSTASVARSWRRFAREFGVSTRALQENHGQPARTLVEKLLGADRVEVGLAWVSGVEVADAPSVEPVPGALAFFAGLPEHRRAVVTSGDPAIATARLRAAGLPIPGVLVTVDDVRRGKPDPEPYLVGARRLGVAPERCLVVEDAPAGIASARAAGCRVLAVGGTDSAAALADADMVVDGLDRVAIRPDGDALRLFLVTDDIRPDGSSCHR